MGIGDWDWGLGIGDWAQSPIPNPQSPIPNPHIFNNIFLKLLLLNLYYFLFLKFGENRVFLKKLNYIFII